MNWKQFKKLFSREAYDESRFILGLDLGNDTSVMSFFNMNTYAPEVIDLSGGYGKPSVPTVMQYVFETKEWVFGEYAVLNKGVGRDLTLGHLMEKLGRKEYIDIESKSVSIVNVLGLYLKELIGSVRQINPNAAIVGIVAAIPSYMGEAAKEELTAAFAAAGYAKELIGLFSDRECVFSRYYFDHKTVEERVLMLDFGSREIRGGVYDAKPDGGGVAMRCVSSLFDGRVGAKTVNDTVLQLFTHFFCRATGQSADRLPPQIQGQLEAFTYQHKDLLFNKSKAVRLYFNFAYPPFQQNMSKDELETFVQPFSADFRSFIHNVLSKNVYAGARNIAAGDIDRVVCVGGGFEMGWAKAIVQDIFKDSHIVTYKNAKAVISEGAAVLAAAMLGAAEVPELDLEDKNQLGVDIGVKVLSERRERFIPIVERHSFWWQHHPPKLLMLNEKTDKPVSIAIFKRDAYGEVSHLQDVELDGLPQRPRGTTRIKLAMRFENFDKLTITASDCGFGELFPKVEYEREFHICEEGI